MELPKKMKIKTINRLTLIFTFLVLLFTSIGYSALSANLKISGDVDFNYDPGSTLADVFTTDNPLIIEYKGEGWVGDTNPYFTNHIYYWHVPSSTYNGHTSEENTAIVKNSWNVVFGEFCWQMVRTTESGGIKLLYNGKPIVGTSNGITTYDCGDNRPLNDDTDLVTLNLSGTKMYGTGYTKSLTNATTTFTLTGTVNSQMTSSTINSLVGMYTCGNTTGTCVDKLYKIDSFVSRRAAYVSKVTNTNSIEVMNFNSASNSIVYVGYMYSSPILTSSFTSSSSGGGTMSVKASDLSTNDLYAFSNTYSYDSSTNKYTISLTDSVLISDFSDTTSINNHHYVCLVGNTLSARTYSCTDIGYVFLAQDGKLYYVVLSNGQYISTDTSSTSGITKWADNNNLLYKSLYANDININSSLIKNRIDSWYEDNFLGTSYESKIDDTEIYCADRRTSNNFGSWNLNANMMTNYLNFHYLGKKNISINGNNVYVYNISCPNKPDSYSKTSTAKGNGSLTYPIALISNNEIDNSIVLKSKTTIGTYWTMSPSYYEPGLATIEMSDGSSVDVSDWNYGFAVRPYIALINGTKFSSGDGSMTNPYIVDMSN